MNYRILLAFLLAAATVPASTIVYGFERGVVDKIFGIAIASTSEGLGLASLEHIAEGHPEQVDAGVAVQTGLKSTPHGLEGFKTGTVRAYSIMKIGQTGSAAAITYLSALKPEYFAGDDYCVIFAGAPIALRSALLNQTADPQRKIESVSYTHL